MDQFDNENDECPSCRQRKKETIKSLRRKELGFSCMLNTEVGAILAVIRRPDYNTSCLNNSDDYLDPAIMSSLKSLRSLIFDFHQEWRRVDPCMYVFPFIDVIQSEEVVAAATGVALSAILKILNLGVFDEKTPGAKEAINAIVTGIVGCRLEKTNPVNEDAVMMKILQVLTGVMKHKAAVLLTDQSVSTVVNTCFQVVQQSAGKGDLLHRSARYTMHELIQIIFARLPDVDLKDVDPDSGTDTDDSDIGVPGYGVRCTVDIFHFLCSLLNVVQIVETEGSTRQTSDEEVQLFALVLINSAIEFSGDGIAKHPKLLRMIQDDIFHHLIHYGTRTNPLVLSMICSAVLNAYNFLRRFIRLQLEAFFEYVMLKVAAFGSIIQIQEVALEGIINFCRQPTFIVEAYVNYDCDPFRVNVFEDIGKLLCKQSFPVSSSLTTSQVQAFEGLVVIIHNMADNIDKDDDSPPLGSFNVSITGYKPFWEDKSKDEFDELDDWIEFVRMRKLQKKKMMVAANHFNRDEKKGLEYLTHSLLISDPPDPKAYAYFFRYSPGLDRNFIGEYLGDPDEFHIEVLKEFTETFHFAGMILDSALRTFLETFRLPGESQKIHRIIEAFSEKYYEQHSSEIFVSKDAVFILCYSLIMLNTDQHNPQVKKKMTEDEFIKNNRAINGGQDLPREYLSELFHSISTKAISLFGQTGTTSEMTPSKWAELISRSALVQPYIQCDFDHRFARDMFACIAGPSVAALFAFFEHADEEDLIHECIEGLFSVARIAQFGLEDTLDELISSFCKFTTLLNPYASAEETLFVFTNDLKPKMATLAIFTVANNFGESIRGGWRNIVDCLLKLKKLKLLPQSVIELDVAASSSSSSSAPATSESGVILPSHNLKSGSRNVSSIMSRFSQFLSLENTEESLSLGLGDFEQNLKIIKQCQIGSIFTNSCNIPDDCLLNLGRSLIFAAAGKGQKFSTSVEEEDTVAFCWELITVIATVNSHRLQTFWPSFHDYLLIAAKFPLFSPIPFAEKGIVAILKVCVKYLSVHNVDKIPEEWIFTSVNFMWRLDKESLDTCCDFIAQSMTTILIEHAGNLQTQLGWKISLHLLSVMGRHAETYERGVETLISLLSNTSHISRTNYAYCIDCAFSFVALKNTPLDKNMKILDLLSNSVNLLVQWQRTPFSDPGSSGASVASNTSNSSIEDSSRSNIGSPNFVLNLFLKLGEALRKTSLARREEIRNYAVQSLRKSFSLAQELDFSSNACITCFELIVFAMVGDLHEKMLEYSRRDNSEKEMRSMEETLKIAMELLVDVFLQFLKDISESIEFRTFWLGVLRRMDTCMKAELGPYGNSKLQDEVPDYLRRMISKMKETQVLVPKENDDLYEITNIQIQWIAPALKDELFPES